MAVPRVVRLPSHVELKVPPRDRDVTAKNAASHSMAERRLPFFKMRIRAACRFKLLVLPLLPSSQPAIEQANPRLSSFGKITDLRSDRLIRGNIRQGDITAGSKLQLF